MDKVSLPGQTFKDKVVFVINIVSIVVQYVRHPFQQLEKLEKENLRLQEQLRLKEDERRLAEREQQERHERERQQDQERHERERRQQDQERHERERRQQDQERHERERRQQDQERLERERQQEQEQLKRQQQEDRLERQRQEEMLKRKEKEINKLYISLTLLFVFLIVVGVVLYATESTDYKKDGSKVVMDWKYGLKYFNFNVIIGVTMHNTVYTCIYGVVLTVTVFALLLFLCKMCFGETSAG